MTKPDDLVWVDVITFLRTKHPGICRQWFEEIEPVGVSGGVFEARVSDRIRREYLQRECVEPFNEAMQAVTGRLLTIRFIAGETEIEATPEAAASGALNGASRNERLGGHAVEGPAIVPDYTFEHFVQGPENRLAHAASVAVAQSPGESYNPLFIHGGVGLGKTHLLQAIYQTLARGSQPPVMKYVSCEDFSSQFMEAVQAGEMFGFRHRFRHVDVLIIDDIHFLADRDRTQEEFFHTFNTLYQTKKQIVLSSDAPPSEIPALEDRLVSRFKSGLVVEVGPPAYETRVQIIKQKAKMKTFELSDEVACFIASQTSSNIRELEGALTQVQMVSATDQEPITVDLARRALGPKRPEKAQPAVTITVIIDAVVDFYGVKMTDLQSKRRQKSIAHPRQVCMSLARKMTPLSLEEIGGYFGGRDHTTVMHAVKTVDRKRQEDGDLARVLSTLEERIRRRHQDDSNRNGRAG